MFAGVRDLLAALLFSITFVFVSVVIASFRLVLAPGDGDFYGVVRGGCSRSRWRDMPKFSVAARNLLFAIAAFVTMSPAAHAQVVISQVYGGGGNSGATLKNDFIEIFNRGSAAVNVPVVMTSPAASGANFG